MEPHLLYFLDEDFDSFHALFGGFSLCVTYEFSPSAFPRTSVNSMEWHLELGITKSTFLNESRMERAMKGDSLYVQGGLYIV
jgi:hypothetical protein